MTLITGHRGARNLWAENSLTGFRNVLDLGVDAVEFDVHLTTAGELVVIHDATLDRTTDHTGPVRALLPEARQKVMLKDTHEAIPTLSEVLEVLAPANRLAFHIEIKADETGTPYQGIVERVAGEIGRFGIGSRSCLTSFDTSVLEDCRRQAPAIVRLVSISAISAEKHGGISQFLEKIDGLAKLVAVHYELLEAEWDIITDAVPIEDLCVWTVNDEETIRRWLARGIGHLTSDAPDLALKLRGEVAAL